MPRILPRVCPACGRNFIPDWNCDWCRRYWACASHDLPGDGELIDLDDEPNPRPAAPAAPSRG